MNTTSACNAGLVMGRMVRMCVNTGNGHVVRPAIVTHVWPVTHDHMPQKVDLTAFGFPHLPPSANFSEVSEADSVRPHIDQPGTWAWPGH